MDDANIAHLIRANVPAGIPAENKERFITFAEQFYKFYRDMNFAYLEINPIVMIGNDIVITSYSIHYTKLYDVFLPL